MYQFVDVYMCGVLEQAQANTTPQGKTVVKGKIKINKTFNGQSFSSSFIIEGWEEKGKALLNCQVGSLIFIRGELKNEKYLDPQTGQEKWTQKVSISTVGEVPVSPVQAQYQGQPASAPRVEHDPNFEGKLVPLSPQPQYQQRQAPPPYAPGPQGGNPQYGQQQPNQAPSQPPRPFNDIPF